MTEAAQHRRRALALAALFTAVFLGTAPAVPNSDGLGYLKLLPHNFAAGHLLFMPVLRAATRLVGDGLRAGRLLDALLGGSALLLLYSIVRRTLGALPLGRPFSAADVRGAATIAVAGLAVSWGFWVQAADVEAYALALVALLVTVRVVLGYRATPSLARALGCGVALGAAVLTHLTHVMLTVVVVWGLVTAPAPDGARRRGWRDASVAVGLGGALALGAYAWAALVVRGHDLAAALRWISTAAHGFRESGGLYRIGDAVYGLAKAFVWSPYVYEGDAPKLLTLFLAGLAPVLGFAVLVVARRRLLPSSVWHLGLAWVLPYALVGLCFFGSDSERWVFVLPALWGAAGALLVTVPAGARLASATIAFLAAVNVTVAIRPAMRDDAGTRARVEEAAPGLRDGDLVVFPGHSWDEYVALYARARVEPFPLSYYAARDGVAAGFARLERDAARVTAAGGRVVTLRLFRPDDDPRGFDELRLLGLPRPTLERELESRFTVAPLDARVIQLTPRAR